MDPYRIARDTRTDPEERGSGDGVILWVILAAGALTAVGARDGQTWGAGSTLGLLVALAAAAQLARHAWARRSGKRRSRRRDVS